MSEPVSGIEPVHKDAPREVWTQRLLLFVRVMAGLSLVKGLYHWAQVCGIGTPFDVSSDVHSMAWRVGTTFFAVIDLVAGVGLWLAAAWGAVLWLLAALSMAAVELFVPQAFGGRLWVVTVEFVLVLAYLVLTYVASRENPD